MSVVSLSSRDKWTDLEQDISTVPIPLESLNPLQAIADKLLFSTQNAYPADAAKTVEVTVLFINKIKQYPHNQASDQLCTQLQSLLEKQLLHLPKEMLVEILTHLSVPELLKIRLINSYFKSLIDNDSILQTRIAYYAFEANRMKGHISCDTFRFYSNANKLSVEVNQSLTLWKLNDSLSKRIPWISNLIVKNAEPSELKTLFTHLADSKKLKILYLCNCILDQECCDQLLKILHLQKDTSFLLYLGNVNTLNCSPLEERMSTYSCVKYLDESECEKYTIECFLEKEPDRLALQEFEAKVLSESSSSEELFASALALKPWTLLPIITSVWFSALMDPVQSLPMPTREIQKRVLDFLKQNPHHMAIVAAIKTHQTTIKSTSLR